MYRLFSFIPIFRGDFLIKSAKRMCICDYIKNRISTLYNLRFDVKKGYKQKIAPDRCKIYCYTLTCVGHNTLKVNFKVKNQNDP